MWAELADSKQLEQYTLFTKGKKKKKKGKNNITGKCIM